MKSLACVKAANGSPLELEGCRAERGRGCGGGGLVGLLDGLEGGTREGHQGRKEGK